MLRAHLARHWFVYAVPLAFVVAWAWPDGMRSDGHLAAGRWWQGLIVAIFLGSGLSLPGRELVAALARWRLHLFIQGFSLLLVPALAWLAVRGLAPVLGPELAIGCIFLACQPTTIAGCIAMTRAADGDVAAALFNAAVGNLLGIVVTPAMGLLLTGVAFSSPFAKVLGDLALLVAMPFLVGQVVRLLVPAIAGAAPWINRLTLGCLLGILIHVFSDSIHKGLPALPGAALPVLVVGVVGGHLLVLALAWWLAGWRLWHLEPAGRITALICASQKTAALGVPMLATCFPHDPRLALFTLPLLIWHPTQLTVASLMSSRLARWRGRVAHAEKVAVRKD